MIFSLFAPKVIFSRFSPQKCTLLTFYLKTIFCPKSDFGHQNAIRELREPPAGAELNPAVINIGMLSTRSVYSV